MPIVNDRRGRVSPYGSECVTLYEDRYAILPEMGKTLTTNYLLNRLAESRMLAFRDAEFGRVFGLIHQVAALVDEALQRSDDRAGDQRTDEATEVSIKAFPSADCMVESSVRPFAPDRSAEGLPASARGP